MFGFGIYLAENASKSDEYAPEDEDGLHYTFLCRVLLGRPFHNRDPAGKLLAKVLFKKKARAVVSEKVFVISCRIHFYL